VVGEEAETSAFQKEPEMADGAEGGKEFPVKGRVTQPGPCSFLEKKTRGPHNPTWRCCRTPPTWVSEALVVRERGIQDRLHQGNLCYQGR